MMSTDMNPTSSKTNHVSMQNFESMVTFYIYMDGLAKTIYPYCILLEHSDSSFVYGFMSLDYSLGNITTTTYNNYIHP